MNNNVKVLLTIQGIPGATTHERVKVIKVKGKKQRIKILDEVTATIKMNLTQDAYDWMTSVEKPYWYRGLWNKLSRKNRLELHLARICDDRRGTSFVYSVLED